MTRCLMRALWMVILNTNAVDIVIATLRQALSPHFVAAGVSRRGV